MENQNPNTPEGETPSQETPTHSFSVFTEDYSMVDHLKAEKAGIDQDLELSKRSFNPKKSEDSIMEDSHFSGKDQKPFDTVVPPIAETKKNDLPKGKDYRSTNNSSLL